MLNCFEEAILEECKKIKSSVFRNIIENENIGYSFAGKFPTSYFGPLKSQEATDKIGDLTLEYFQSEKLKNNEILRKLNL